MADVVMYTADYCSYCRAAKRFLAEVKQVPVVEVDVTFDHEKRAWLRETTGQATVPQIFIGDVHVGGYTELRAKDASGEIDRLLGR